ncbi:MAG: hypothetical protein RMY64_32960 [Nostoc sp. DedQUE08]|uniref:hypothetical protein n=1 Tax=Nostoc sp. DedQUE08 TaxID=3075393 RepID=UPI002AD4F5BB|nr:hypothetical protein [Nostoc sp. DedQUE08]MDZ8070368.1 hypothetical protein [Nostoc sp. DedQUE08]
MENFSRNVKTKEISRANSQQDAENDRQRLGGFGGSGFVDGIGQQNRFVSRACEENNPDSNTYFIGNKFECGSSSGKLLEEVLLLKQQFLEYVKSDQDRLEARLSESKKQEEQFLAHAEIIEKRLRTALLIQEPTNNNE